MGLFTCVSTSNLSTLWSVTAYGLFAVVTTLLFLASWASNAYDMGLTRTKFDSVVPMCWLPIDVSVAIGAIKAPFFGVDIDNVSLSFVIILYCWASSVSTGLYGF